MLNIWLTMLRGVGCSFLPGGIVRCYWEHAPLLNPFLLRLSGGIFLASLNNVKVTIHPARSIRWVQINIC